MTESLTQFERAHGVNHINGRVLNANVPITSLNLGVRASNVLRGIGVDTMPHLVNLTARELLSSRNCGAATIQEILRAMLVAYIRPVWMIGVASKLEYEIVPTPPHGYARITAPILPEERWIAECVIADMVRSRVPWCVIAQTGNTIAVARHGATVTDDESE